MKKTIGLAILLALILGLGISARPRDYSEDLEKAGREVASGFFSAFESSDYGEMREYCTASCIEKYFHNDNVFGMTWASLESTGEQLEIGSHGSYNLLVNIEMKTSPESALYPEEETSFYLVMEKTGTGELLIDGFVTGY